MLILSRKKDQIIKIGDEIELWVVDIRGDTVKLGINAPRHVKVFRQEVAEEIEAANQAAVSSKIDPSKLELPFPEADKE